MICWLWQVYTKPPVSLHGQLLWREFFYTAGVGTANFNRMEGNPVCTQVPWDSNPEYLAAWSEVYLSSFGCTLVCLFPVACIF